MNLSLTDGNARKIRKTPKKENGRQASAERLLTGQKESLTFSAWHYPGNGSLETLLS